MNRRTFLRSLGVAIVAVPVVAKAITAPPEPMLGRWAGVRWVESRFWREVRWIEIGPDRNDPLMYGTRIGLKARTPTGEQYGAYVRIVDATEASLPRLRAKAKRLLSEQFDDIRRRLGAGIDPNGPAYLATVEGLAPSAVLAVL